MSDQIKTKIIVPPAALATPVACYGAGRNEQTRLEQK